MRPWSIVDFERIMLGTLALGLLKTWLDWDMLMAMQRAGGNASPAASILLGTTFTFALTGGLTLLVSRRRSRIAMWISIASFLLGIPALIALFAAGVPMGTPVITALQTIGRLVAYGLLFTPSARRWMKRVPDVPSEIFR